MLETFQATLSPMLVMFLCMLIGFVLNKKKIVPENTATILSRLENYVLVPALIISTFMKYCTVASLSEQYRLILYCVLSLAIGLVLAHLLVPFFTKDSYKKNIYRYALTFGNFGFMGNAIVPAILGDAELYHYMLYTLPLNLTVYTWGVAILIPKTEQRQNPLKSLCNPTFVAIVIGILLGLFRVGDVMPGFISTTIQNLAACMGPLAMVLTGFVIGNYHLPTLLKDKKVYIATALRLFLLPALFIGILWLIGAGKLPMTLTLFAFATPLGLNTVVFPAAYGGDTSTGASMAMISHTLCVVTIPLMYALLQVVTG